MASIAAIVVAVFWCVVAFLIAWSRGYSPGGIAICMLGIIAGGIGAGLPGAYALSGWNAIVSRDHTVTAACAAVLIGALCGLYVAERLRDHQFPTNRQVMTAGAGFLFGGVAAYVIVFFTHDTWAEQVTLFVLAPVTVASATLAGSAISHQLPD